MRESKAKSFGKFLSCHKTQRLDGSATAYTYHVPDHLCRVYSKTKVIETEPVFSTAAILAVFDEFSTYGLMSQCKTSRGGVSVHLTTEIIGKSVAGEEVVLKTNSDKIGKALGFCTMELHSKDGRLLARGKHIKYMPMGSLWDFIASPMFLPITLAIYEYLTTTSFGKYLLGLFSGKKKGQKHSETAVEKEKEITGVGAVFAELGLKPIQYTDASSGTGSRSNAFEFKAGRHLHNLMDKLHGGAVAAAIEEACMMTRRPASGSTSRDEYFVQAMEVRYLAPMKVSSSWYALDVFECDGYLTH
jgi:acyl-coenzyme A thioesterase PaaI-like protein